MSRRPAGRTCAFAWARCGGGRSERARVREASRESRRAEQSGPGVGRGGAAEPRGRGGGKGRGKEEKENGKRKKKKGKMENDKGKKRKKNKKGGERERDSRRNRGARSATRGAGHACAVGRVRGSRVNMVVDTGVRVGSSEDREIGRKSLERTELNDENYN